MAQASKNNLRVVIFAGGVGTRMWPLSRKATPKQFEKIIKNKSTLQLTIDRLRPEIDYKNIYVSTGRSYVDIIKKQLPRVPKENIIGEPEMRDVAPAVGYLMAILAKQDPNGPVAILWSDHLMKNVSRFKKVINTGAEYIRQNPELFVFLGEKPRFANQNLGWIEYGAKMTTLNDFKIRKFSSWHYRPKLEKAKKYFDSGRYAWNPGYFIVSPQFVIDQFKKHVPDMYQALIKLQSSYGSLNHKKELEKIYPNLKKTSFDDAILEKISPSQAVVIPVDLGWSDVGTWEALKEALQTSPSQNLTKGQVVAWKTKNSLIYNYTDQLVATIDLKGIVVVITKDAVLVTPQESIPEIKKMLKSFTGTDLEKFT